MQYITQLYDVDEMFPEAVWTAPKEYPVQEEADISIFSFAKWKKRILAQENQSTSPNDLDGFQSLIDRKIAEIDKKIALLESEEIKDGDSRHDEDKSDAKDKDGKSRTKKNKKKECEALNRKVQKELQTYREESLYNADSHVEMLRQILIRWQDTCSSFDRRVSIEARNIALIRILKKIGMEAMIQDIEALRKTHTKRGDNTQISTDSFQLWICGIEYAVNRVFIFRKIQRAVQEYLLEHQELLGLSIFKGLDAATLLIVYIWSWTTNTSRLQIAKKMNMGIDEVQRNLDIMKAGLHSRFISEKIISEIMEGIE